MEYCYDKEERNFIAINQRRKERLFLMMTVPYDNDDSEEGEVMKDTTTRPTMANTD